MDKLFGGLFQDEECRMWNSLGLRTKGMTWVYKAICCILLSCHLWAAEVLHVQWESQHTASVVALKNEALLSAIRMGVNHVPEPLLMQWSAVGGTSLGLPPQKAKELQELLGKYYERIAKNAAFAQVPSALPYCYSATRPKHGLASVYVPDEVTGETGVIVFLHGYGGSFTFYLHYLAQVFPKHVIICPAYGISSSTITSAYLSECKAAVEQKLETKLAKPLLIGLSAGGFGGFKEYAKNESAYRGFICMASYPPKSVISQLARESKVRLIVGGEEGFMKNGRFVQRETLLKARVRNCSSYVVAKCGHFFMLENEPETQKVLQKWEAELK